MKSNRFLRIGYSVFALVAMWVLWWLAFCLTENDLIVPSPSRTLIAVWELLCSVSFWKSFGGTLLRTLIGFLSALLPAAILAYVSCSHKRVRYLTDPFLSVLRTMPTMAVILIFLIWTTPRIAPVLVTWLVTFPMLYADFLSALDAVFGEYEPLAKAYRFTKIQTITKIYLPLCAPFALGSIGAQLSLSLKVMVSAEVLSKTYESLGGMMNESKMYFEVPQLFALTILVVLSGMALERVCLLCKRKIVRWREDDTNGAH